ncbi:MAG: FecR family protein [Armatimonas sp.]
MYDSDREKKLKNSSDPNYRKNELRRMATDQVIDTIRGVLVLIGIGLVVLFIDGWRRDYGNLSVELMAHKGTVDVAVPKDGKQSDVVPNDGIKLDAGAQITTGQDSFATIAFPDGSAIRVEANSSLGIELLDYFRTGRRDRAFSLGNGSVFVRQSPNAGPLSLLSVSTGNAIIAGRAGSSWRVSHQNNVSRVEVISGGAVLRTATIRREVKPGQMSDSEGSVSTLPSNGSG